MKSKLTLISVTICSWYFVSCGSKNIEPVKVNNNDTNSVKQDSIPKKVNIEDQVIDSVFALPEVQERKDYIEKQTKGKRTLSVMINETPDENNKGYYAVKAGEDNGESMVTHFNFNVYVPSFRITYEDPIMGEEISLDEWRKQPK